MTTRGRIARGQNEQQVFTGRVRKWTKKWITTDSTGATSLRLLKWVPTENRYDDEDFPRFPHLVVIDHTQPVAGATTAADHEMTEAALGTALPTGTAIAKEIPPGANPAPKLQTGEALNQPVGCTEADTEMAEPREALADDAEGKTASPSQAEAPALQETDVPVNQEPIHTPMDGNAASAAEPEASIPLAEPDLQESEENAPAMQSAEGVGGPHQAADVYENSSPYVPSADRDQDAQQPDPAGAFTGKSMDQPTPAAPAACSLGTDKHQDVVAQPGQPAQPEPEKQPEDATGSAAPTMDGEEPSSEALGAEQPSDGTTGAPQPEADATPFPVVD